MLNRTIVIVISIVVTILLYVLIPGLKNDRDYSLANVAFQSDKWEKASIYYEKVISYEPHSSKALTRLGYCYLKLGHLNKAIETFQKSLHADSSHFRTYRWLGDAFLQKKAYSDAAKTYEQLISVYRSHHSLSKEDADDYMYAFDKLVLCELELQNDPLALRQLHEFTSVLRTKVK